jgi:hypothetical protein
MWSTSKYLKLNLNISKSVTTVTGQSVTGGLLFLACNPLSGDSAGFCILMTNVLQLGWLPSVPDDKLTDGTGLP